MLTFLLLRAHQGISLTTSVAVAGSMMQAAGQSLRAQVALEAKLIEQVHLWWVLGSQLFCLA